MKEIIYYKLKNGKCPYFEWYNSLDKGVKLQIDRRIERLRFGNLGLIRRFDNITEIKFTQHSGYRIYAYECNNILIIFLSAGNKKTQKKDIELAKQYLKEFKERYK